MHNRIHRCLDKILLRHMDLHVTVFIVFCNVILVDSLCKPFLIEFKVFFQIYSIQKMLFIYKEDVTYISEN